MLHCTRWTEVESVTFHAYIGSSDALIPGATPLTTTKTTDDGFENDVLKSSTPVLVDFWAEWCGPCKQIGPALEEIANEMGGRVTVAKLNIDENPMTPGRYGVRGIPTLMVFKDGKVASTKVGAMPKSKIVEWLNESV
jgi:thioredoxin 1